MAKKSGKSPKTGRTGMGRKSTKRDQSKKGTIVHEDRKKDINTVLETHPPPKPKK